MADLSVTITPDSTDGTTAYISGTFSGGSDSYSYAKQLRVTILGDDTYIITSPQTSGGYNTFSLTVTGLSPNTTYYYSAIIYVRVEGGWSASSYEVLGQSFTTAAAASQTYYAYITYNANGGTGAPSAQYGNEYNNTGYVTFYLSVTHPTKSGYVFSGWSLNSDGSGTLYEPGGKIILWGTTSSPGTQHILYAVWTEGTGGTVYVSNGAGYIQGTVWVYNGGWYQGIPWVYTNGAWVSSGS